MAWTGSTAPAFDPADVAAAVHDFRSTQHVVVDTAGARYGVGTGGTLVAAGTQGAWPVAGVLPPLYPEWLGDRSFTEAHGTRFPFVAGAMANGIATVELVVAMAQAGCLGFFGAGGLAFPRVEAAVEQLRAQLGDALPWGANLIHSPNEPALEAAVADLYLRTGVRKVSAAAYMSLTPSIVRYAYSGITLGHEGRVVRPNAVFAKISRPEVARHFMNPAPQPMLDRLVADGLLTADEARLAASLPVAEDYTVESDSGGHTDNRPLGPLFSVIAEVRDEIVAARGYDRPLRLGAAGGIGTPQAVASAFALGAAYVLTGSINQACVESGLSDDGKAMLAVADIADITMAPAADMFELGVDLQVLKRGTMFAPRAKQLYELYRTYPSLAAIPDDVAAEVEKKVLGATLADTWASTREFWLERDAEQVTKAESDPRVKMALTFRSYLGLSSRWAIDGQADRRLDFQIWCGPAMGAFNAWTAGSFLAEPANRTVAQVAMNLLEGAAVLTRAHQLRSCGLAVPSSAFRFTPRPLV
jgi:trans-AT polyketide synthase/acyltransferase/oxidoreductase domain-containing protein